MLLCCCEAVYWVIEFIELIKLLPNNSVLLNAQDLRLATNDRNKAGLSKKGGLRAGSAPYSTGSLNVGGRDATYAEKVCWVTRVAGLGSVGSILV